jgi:hypothetical protein
MTIRGVTRPPPARVALPSDLVPEKHGADIRRAFIYDLSHGRIRSDEIRQHFLFNMLDDARRLDIVLRIRCQVVHPSYMRFLRRRETALLDFWQDKHRGKSHDILRTI